MADSDAQLVVDPFPYNGETHAVNKIRYLHRVLTIGRRIRHVVSERDHKTGSYPGSSKSLRHNPLDV